MAEHGEQAPHRAQDQDPRPPDDLRHALGLQAGYAVQRAPPAAGAPDDASNHGSLGQQVPQGNGGPSIGSPDTRAPLVRPPIRRPAISPAVGAIQSAAAAGTAAASPAVQAAGGGRPLRDDSQADKHCPPETRSREIERRSDGAPSSVGGAEAAESLADSRARFPDEDLPFPEMEDDPMESHRSSLPAADELLEAPEPDDVAPARGPSSSARVDPGKPNGPDYAELRPLIVANMGLTEKSRKKWRRSELAKSSDLDEATKEEIVSKPGRLKVATPETMQEYLAVARRLMNRFKRESDIHVSLEDVDPREFANWLLGLKPFLTSNTWRKYRASAIVIIQTIPSIYLDEAVAMLNADLQVGDDEGLVVSKKKNDQDGVGASLRAKRIDYQHLEQLKRRLRVTTRSRAQGWLRDWLDAGINTGLRPMEWALTSLERHPDPHFPNGRVWLHVVSAKAADGRATHRTLDLSNFSTDALEAVERMVKRSRDWVMTGTWSARQYDVSKLLRKVCQTLFPRMQKQYTLYSLRHQFIASMKTIYTREEVAAMVDHISLDTQVEHYGKKRSAWEAKQITEIPMPVDEQVARIRRRLELFDERRADIAQKEAAKFGRDRDRERADDEEEVGYDSGI